MISKNDSKDKKGEKRAWTDTFAWLMPSSHEVIERAVQTLELFAASNIFTESRLSELAAQLPMMS